MIERDNDAERQARIDTMIAEFHAARQRRLVKVGIALWQRVEESQRELAYMPTPPPDKIH